MEGNGLGLMDCSAAYHVCFLRCKSLMLAQAGILFTCLAGCAFTRYMYPELSARKSGLLSPPLIRAYRKILILVCLLNTFQETSGYVPQQIFHVRPPLSLSPAFLTQ
jgi:hypothetical protein